MVTQSVTLHLPEKVMRRAREAADALQHPLEDVLTALLNAALPDVDDAPPEMRAELAEMTWLNSSTLWEIARSSMSGSQQEKLAYLSDIQTQRPLTQAEQAQLETLRCEYGRATLRKARAYALLSLRSGKPLLTEN